MAKIAHPITEFADIIKLNGIECSENLSPSNRVVKRFIRIAKKVPDKRMQGVIEYPMKEILLVAFFAVLSGAETWTQIAQFGRARESWLGKFLKYRRGTPSHDTFRRVFSLIDPSVLQTLTVDFLMDNMSRIKASLGIRDEVINVDGKQARGTGRRKGKDGARPNLQTLNVFDASNGICLSMECIPDRTNEIPAAQTALALLNVKGAVVTCDTLNTQKETMRVVSTGKGNYMAALKKNHHLFYDEVDAYFTKERMKSIRKGSADFVTSIDKAHSQVERRNFYLARDVKWFADRRAWEKLKAFVCFDKSITDTQSGEVTKERRLFISSVADAGLCAEAIRGHWAVENILYWHLDALFGDDEDMTTDKNAYMNFSQFRRMALTLCKLAQPFMKCSIKSMRWLIGLEYRQELGRILGTLDETFLEEALRAANEKKQKQ
ncbi:MAG: ISAs1 family transposase [Synergistaceae bacterium]|nr:ISAs1 family transposase [Synergistaceae bacterium]